ncbi:MAG: fucose isomerase [Oscillospiraceae bacterium]|nr:fucose isomerase [Oscillospiraceae bacterium]
MHTAASFTVLYVPMALSTYHLESAQGRFEASRSLLRELEGTLVSPEEMLLSLDGLRAYLDGRQPDLIVFQNLTFVNASYMAEVLRRFDCPMLLWTLREPVVDGGRLRLNSLTGAYSAANTLRAFGARPFAYVFGAPEEARVREEIAAVLAAARLKREMRGLKMAAVGHTPQGFGFGRALDAELMSVFGVELESVEARELMAAARSYSDEDCAPWLEKTRRAVCGLENTPEKNRLDHARLYRAYAEFVRSRGIGALASRCWPDFFTEYGAPVCTVLSLLNDEGVAAACEVDIYGALSMWLGMRLSGGPVFFGDPVSLDEAENTLTFWHCGAAACSLARRDTGAVVGVHPNRRIGPAMDFGCEAFPEATIFRIGREPDGRCRFFLAEGEALDKPRQFTGTSVVIRTASPCRALVERSVRDGFEPHFVVIKGRHAPALEALANMFGFEVCRY